MSAELRAVMQDKLVGRARGEPVGGDGQHDGTVRPCAQGPMERAVEGPVEADWCFSTFTSELLMQRAGRGFTPTSPYNVKLYARYTL